MDATGRIAGSRPAGKKRQSVNPVQTLTRSAVDALLEKKGNDVTVMDLRGVSGVADYFVICTGHSDLQIKALADSVWERIRDRHDEKPWHVEGYSHLQWVLLDYVDLVVHIFTPERRAYYSLERLWGDAQIEHVAEDGSGGDVASLKPNDRSAPDR